MRIAIWAARVVVAAVFFYAGVVKIGASEAFAITVANFTILPTPWAERFAFALPWVEAVASLLLLVPRTARAAAFIIAAMLLAFIGALGWALHLGIVVDCGCLGEDPSPTPGKMWLAISRDVGLLGLTLGLAARRTR